MTLAGQFLVLQLLIVLAVLVVVGAIGSPSRHGMLRTHRRPRGAAARREPRRAASRREQIADGATRRTSALSAVGGVRRTVSGSLARGWSRTGRHGAGLVGPDPGRRAASSSAEQTCLDGALLDGVLRTRGQHRRGRPGPVQDEQTGEMVGWSRRSADVPIAAGAARRRRAQPAGLPRRREPARCSGGRCCSRVGSSGRRWAWSPPRSPAWSSTARPWCTASRRASSRSTPSDRVTLVNDSAPSCWSCPRTASAAARRAGPRPAGRSRSSTSASPAPTVWCSSGDRVLAFNRCRCEPQARVIGSVTTLRDRTELSALSGSSAAARRPRHAARTDPRVRQPAAHDLGPPAPRGVRRGAALRRRGPADRTAFTTTSPPASTDADRGRAPDRQVQPGRRARRGPAARARARGSARSTAPSRRT